MADLRGNLTARGVASRPSRREFPGLTARRARSEVQTLVLFALAIGRGRQGHVIFDPYDDSWNGTWIVDGSGASVTLTRIWQLDDSPAQHELYHHALHLTR